MAATPAEVLAALVRSDPGRPRVTFYEDSPGAAKGERIELSAKVLANWVAKAANALQEEWDLGPGSLVRLALPPHWRALYWALAVWSVGATLVLGEAESDLVVGDDPETISAATVPSVLVTLPALARKAGAPVPAGVMDEASELSTYGDQLSVWAEPAPGDVALRHRGAGTAYSAVVPDRDWPVGSRVHTTAAHLDEVLSTALAAWAVDGSVVISRGPEPEGGRVARLASEGVTLEV
ncbi:TIGR03089 family protein [Pedococcus sp. 5OH_020]|uniref:TIGR03089 family protein n=1 Tax=Pedococcus sp. 5OH_020 TaxID=2989814 RepID=UPI0022EA0D7B|nr:TIGR03089 family protein [Pedococcus sp. 5OH_020]